MNKMHLKVVVLTMFLAFSIMILPYFFFNFQEMRLLKYEGSIATSAVNIDKQYFSSISIEGRIKILNAQKEFNSIKLETGYYYSLYEAKIKCFDELCKIPSLEMDRLGPSSKEIDIVPFLIINSKSLSEKMIVWKGQLNINGIKYYFILDEETGKILKIDSDKWINEDYKNTVFNDWKNYLNQSNI